jgi:hypothetical protein
MSLPSRGKQSLLLTITLAAGLLACSRAPAQHAILHLRNGDRLSGYIIFTNTQQVVLTNAWSKEIVLPASEILRRELVTPEPPAAVRAATNAPAPTASSPPPPPVPAPKPKPSVVWAGELQLGLDLGFSEKNRQLYTGRTKITMSYDRMRNTLDSNFAYGRTEGILSANRADGSIKTDYDLTRRFYVYSLAGAGHDEIRKINFRYEVGPGLGYHVIMHTNFLLNAEAGINYQAHYLSDDTESELVFYRFAESFVWRINNRFTLDEKFEFFPRVESFGAYRFRAEANLKYTILNNLFFTLTVLDQYDTDPAEGIGQNDLQVRSTVGVKF